MTSLDDDTSPLPLPPLVATRAVDAARPALPRGERWRQALLGVVDEVGIGDVTLLAVYREPAGERAAPAVLDGVT